MSDQNIEQTKHLELAKLRQTDFINRRGVEWKLSLALWAAIATLSFALLKSEVATETLNILRSPAGSIVVSISSAIILLLHGGLLINLQDSHARDRALYWYHSEMFEGITPAPRRPTRGGSYSSWDRLKLRRDIWSFEWFLYHTLFTAIVLLGVQGAIGIFDSPKSLGFSIICILIAIVVLLARKLGLFIIFEEGRRQVFGKSTQVCQCNSVKSSGPNDATELPNANLSNESSADKREGS